MKDYINDYINDYIIDFLMIFFVLFSLFVIGILNDKCKENEKTISKLKDEIIELKKENKELDELYQNTYSVLVDEGLVGE